MLLRIVPSVDPLSQLIRLARVLLNVVSINGLQEIIEVLFGERLSVLRVAWDRNFRSHRIDLCMGKSLKLLLLQTSLKLRQLIVRLLKLRILNILGGILKLGLC